MYPHFCGGRVENILSIPDQYLSPDIPVIGREEGQNAHCGTLCISMLNNGTFRVTLSLRREPDGGPVFCKMETNQRFKQLKTVKLNTNTTYRIDVSFKPPRALQRDRRRVSLTCDGYGTARTAVPHTPGHRGPGQFLSWYLKRPNPLTPKGGMIRIPREVRINSSSPPSHSLVVPTQGVYVPTTYHLPRVVTGAIYFHSQKRPCNLHSFPCVRERDYGHCTWEINLPLLVRTSGGGQVPARALLTVQDSIGALIRLTARMARPRTPGCQTRRPKPHHSSNTITRRLLNTLPHIIQPIGGTPPQDKLATWAWEPSPVYHIYNESGLTETYQLTGPPRALVGNRCKHQSLWHDRRRQAYVIMSRSLMIAGQEMEPSERFRDSTACAYSSYYNTDGLNHSKKGQREDLAIVMKGHTERNVMYATYALCSMFAMLAIFTTPSGNTGSYDLYETHQLVSSKIFAVGLLWESDDSDDEVQETGELSTCLQVKLYKQRDTQHCEWGSQLHCVELDCCALEGDVSVRVNKETFK
uniref:CB1 cannabinoid receptor-interacting protein 1 n=1 Tax=Timema poppense TaxID=170557 RepID=A0A7R9H4R8_TIMPO|nr:unnamed protein product [Timema poppensis]